MSFDYSAFTNPNPKKPDALVCKSSPVAVVSHNAAATNQTLVATAYDCLSRGNLKDPNALPPGIPMVGVKVTHPSNMRVSIAFNDLALRTRATAAQQACQQIFPGQKVTAIERGPADLHFLEEMVPHKKIEDNFTTIARGYFCQNQKEKKVGVLSTPERYTQEPVFNHIVRFNRGKALSGLQCMPIPGRVPATGIKFSDPAVPGATQAACPAPLPEGSEAW
jgi:hypothetical protein